MDELEQAFRALELEGRDALERSGIASERIVFERAADMRYVGQEHAVAVRMPASATAESARAEIKRRFDEAHDLRYSHSAPDEAADIVSLRVSAIGRLGKPVFPTILAGVATPPAEAERGARAVIFEGLGVMSAKLFDRSKLRAGNLIPGPAIIEEVASTTVVEPGDSVTVNCYGHLIMKIAGA